MTRALKAMLKALVDDFKAIVLDEAETDFPQDPVGSALGCVGFHQLDERRAVTYRRLNSIPASGERLSMCRQWFSVIASRLCHRCCLHPNPSTGENSFYGEFLINAQGEDVVAGIRTCCR